MMTAPPDLPELPELPELSPSDRLPPERRRELVEACFALFRGRLVDLGRAAVELAVDLFEGVEDVPKPAADDFRDRRLAWTDEFERKLDEIHARRMAGTRRKGRRVDHDASLATLRVLTAFDHEKQAELVAASAYLVRAVGREMDALDLRMAVLLGEDKVHELDNPFAPEYVLDAIGASSRAMFPNPRVWRPFMGRLLADLTPVANKLYITLNRFLADQGVLPEIKALLRARSVHRPEEDKDLLGAFGALIKEKAPVMLADVAVPTLAQGANDAPVFDFSRFTPAATDLATLLPSALVQPARLGMVAQALAAIDAGAAGPPGSAPLPSTLATEVAAALEGRDGAVMSAPAILSGLAALAAAGERLRATGGPPMPEGGFPSLDPLMALGTSTPLFSTLGHWQKLDLPEELQRLAAGAGEGSVPTIAIPLNLIPHIRAAVAHEVKNPNDHVTMDVIALVFDYIFRDPSIPDEERRLFQRLQIAVLKAALLDRTFFSDAGHPARRLLDRLAEGAIAATQDEAYRRAFEIAASGVIDEVARDFDVDISVFDRADARLAAFLESDRAGTATITQPAVEKATAAEASDVHGTTVRALVRDRLAGLDLPFEVRSFVETVWADHLAASREAGGEDGPEWISAVRTLDDLLWSITAKDRTAQKQRLARLVPSLIANLRHGAAIRQAPDDKVKPFFDLVFRLHMDAIRPKPEPVVPEAARASSAALDAVPETPGLAASAPPTPEQTVPSGKLGNVHDFVSEMAVGTWLTFVTGGGSELQARLSWVSPKRTKYLFTSRSRARAFILTPEEVAWRLGAGKATLLLEPVPLFDRAVSAALDSLGNAPANAAAAGS